jgi:O-antigen/teichoic acid export membrane protein
LKEFLNKHLGLQCLKWSKLLGITGGGQTLVKVATFLSGLVVVRLLNVEQYAFYTLANTMLGTIAILANSGITAGVIAQGGKVWNNKKELGAVMKCGMQLRSTFAACAFCIGAPVVIWLLIRNGATWTTSFLIVGALFPAFFASLSTTILSVPLRLHQQIWPLQRISLVASLWRLAATLPILWLMPTATAALIVAGASQVYSNLLVRRASTPYADLESQVKPEVREGILSMVKKILPNAVYFAFSSQIAIWLVSIFGSAVAIAQIGALSRFGVAIAIFNSVVSMLLVPRFAKLPSSSRLLAVNFVRVQVLVWLAICILLGAVYIFADPLLWLLGPDYHSFRSELFVMFLSSFVGIALFAAAALNECRGWVVAAYFQIPISFAAQLYLAWALHPTTAYEAFLFMLTMNIVLYILQIALFVLKIVSIRKADN